MLSEHHTGDRFPTRIVQVRDGGGAFAGGDFGGGREEGGGDVVLAEDVFLCRCLGKRVLDYQ